ncbi:hypothetical protein [Paenibacillus jilunlii]|uniref:Uncharacterized protein n=1 Tax=Paenibacillus jilunlii TaxID=682956 RepID=A0A1G9PCG5_9BACL|nr:hypothetical protein [Paenibacillus jilunlii]KWX70708.1 hypothetical protein AML91_27045 [Paenibacillus jilunlii]SDL96506.1 hypothetical protein SAMN05216191_107142 [Paenibacillus jilunlii]
MAYNNKNNNNFGYGNNGNGGVGGNSTKNSNGAPLETEELDAEDYAIIAAGLTALGDIFAFLSLVKAKQVTKETGGQAGIDPVLFIQSRKKKAAKRKNRPLR